MRSAFAGSEPFVVAGPRSGGSAAVIDAGLEFATGASSRLRVTCAGRFGSDVREHAGWLTFAAEF